MSPLHSFIACAGRWRGVNLLWTSPEEPAEESASSIFVTAMLMGSFIRLDQTWVREGSEQEGSLLIGYDPKANLATVHWIDTFHNGSKVMACTGTIDADGTVDVRGRYAAPPGPDWGWRIKILAPTHDRLQMEMYNIHPGGEEEIAVRATCSPAPPD